MSAVENSHHGSRTTFGQSEHALARKALTNTRDAFILKSDQKNRPMCGPFRSVMNAGDLLGRQFLQCDCPNPLGKTAAKLTSGDGVSRTGCGLVRLGYSVKQVPIANCNPRYVYDASDYTRFKKLNAQRKDYAVNPGHLSTKKFVKNAYFRIR